MDHPVFSVRQTISKILRGKFDCEDEGGGNYKVVTQDEFYEESCVF